MIDFPREVRAGDRVSATEFNRVVRALRRLMPLQGPGIKLSSTPSGTVFSADAVSLAAGPTTSAVVNEAPWVFVQGPDADPSSTFVPSGEWTRAIVQIGTDRKESGKTYNGTTFYISGLYYTNGTQPITGDYYLVYNTSNDSFAVQAVAPNASAPTTSYADNRIVFYIGHLVIDSAARTVTQTDGVYAVPVLPVYL